MQTIEAKNVLVPSSGTGPLIAVGKLTDAALIRKLRGYTDSGIQNRAVLAMHVMVEARGLTARYLSGE